MNENECQRIRILNSRFILCKELIHSSKIVAQIESKTLKVNGVKYVEAFVISFDKKRLPKFDFVTLYYNEEIKKQHFCTSEVEQWLDVLEFTEA